MARGPDGPFAALSVHSDGMNRKGESMIVEVKARNLEPGDVLHCEIGGESVTDSEWSPTKWTSRWNSAFLQSKAYMLSWQQLALAGGLGRTEERKAMYDRAHRVEHASYGLFKARVVLASGSVVRVPRNVTLAVHRKDQEL